MRIDGDIAITLAGQASYLHLIGLNGKVRPTSLKENTGARYLKERGFLSADLYQVLKDLNVNAHKIMILRLLRRHDLYNLLPLLNKGMILNGLRYFSKEQLLRIIQHMPPELVVKMLLHVFPLHKIFEKMPTAQLFAILRSHKVDERLLVKAFAGMELKYLQFLMMKMTGKDASHLQKAEILDMFKQFKKREFLDAMKLLPWKALTPFVEGLAKNDPTLLENLSAYFVCKLFSDMGKQFTLQAFEALPEDRLLRILGQLPDKGLIMVASQIDTTVFENYLMAEQPDLLFMLAGAEAA